MIGDAALLTGRRFERGVRRDARDEVIAQVGGKVGKASIAEHLRGPKNGGGVDMKALGHFARRQEASLVRGIKDGSNQTLPARVELMPGFRQARLKRTGRRFAVAVGTVKTFFGFLVCT